MVSFNSTLDVFGVFARTPHTFCARSAIQLRPSASNNVSGILRKVRAFWLATCRCDDNLQRILKVQRDKLGDDILSGTPHPPSASPLPYQCYTRYQPLSTVLLTEPSHDAFDSYHDDPQAKTPQVRGSQVVPTTLRWAKLRQRPTAPMQWRSLLPGREMVTSFKKPWQCRWKSRQAARSAAELGCQQTSAACAPCSPLQPVPHHRAAKLTNFVSKLPLSSLPTRPTLAYVLHSARISCCTWFVF